MAARLLRIILAIGVYEDRGGAAESVRRYGRWLAGRGHRVCVVCERAEAQAPEGCELRELEKGKWTKNSWRRAGLLQNLVREWGAEVVHDTGCLRAADVFHPLMGSLMHNWWRQLRAYPRGLGFRRFWHVRMWRDVRLQFYQMGHCRRLIACSELAARDFRQLGRAGAVVVRNGIGATAAVAEVAELREKLGVAGRVMMLASAGNFYLKGVMTILRALALLDATARGKMLVVIGGAEPTEVFRDFVERHGLEKCCRFVGHVEGFDVYYQAAEVFLHPTYHDAGSLSTLKAIASGCAVVSSRFDGSAELLKKGETGWVLKNPGDARELAEVMKRMLEAGVREGMRGRVRALVPETREEQYFEQMEKIYGELVGEAVRR